MFKHTITGLTIITLLAGSAAMGQTSAFDEYAALGISADTGELTRYNFREYSAKRVGTVKDRAGETMLGIQASGYIPGHNNIIAFWRSPSDGNTRLLYVNTQTARAATVGQHLGACTVGGAVAGPNGTSKLAGSVNINPNNNDDYEFTMTTGGASDADGSINHLTYTRDYLHHSAKCDADGTLYDGPCSYIRVRPKGTGKQNSLVVDGENATLSNSSIYVLVGDMDVRLWNDQINGGQAMGHWWIEVRGKASVHENGNMKHGGSTGDSPWAMYAVQHVTTTGSDPIAFGISSGTVTPTEAFAAKFTVLGAAVSKSGLYDMPVTVTLNAGSTSATPFGDYHTPLDGNVNDGNNPRSHIFPSQFTAGTPLSIKATVWQKTSDLVVGDQNSDWEPYAEYDSGSGTKHVMVLRDGDDVPNTDGFLDQLAIEDFIRDYIDPDTNTMQLDANQAIYLFEFGSTTGSSADFQDLVMLVSLAEQPEDFLASNGPEGSADRLIKVNHKTGGYSLLMQLERQYDSLATLDGLAFLATSGHELYLINVVSQTETLMGVMPAGDVHALEFADTTLAGFEHLNDTLAPLNLADGTALGSSLSIGMTNLGTLIFMPIDKDPANKPVAYD